MPARRSAPYSAGTPSTYQPVVFKWGPFTSSYCCLPSLMKSFGLSESMSTSRIIVNVE